MGDALWVVLVAVRVVRELGCPEKIVRSFPDIPVAGFDIIELPGAVSTRLNLRPSYGMHARIAGMSEILDNSQLVHTSAPLGAGGWGTGLKLRWALNHRLRICVDHTLYELHFEATPPYHIYIDVPHVEI